MLTTAFKCPLALLTVIGALLIAAAPASAFVAPQTAPRVISGLAHDRNIDVWGVDRRWLAAVETPGACGSAFTAAEPRTLACELMFAYNVSNPPAVASDLSDFAAMGLAGITYNGHAGLGAH